MSDIGERKLKEELQRIAKDDFVILPNVKGKHLIHTNRQVEIDFMFYPKEHLINAGFDSIWFGVKCDTENMSRFVCQSISYVQSEFQIEGKMIRPVFVLGYSNVEDVIANSNPNESAFQQWFRLSHLAGLMNVGVFEKYEPKRNSPLGGWYIRFITSHWFWKKNGEYFKSKYNIYKVNVGNCSE